MTVLTTVQKAAAEGLAINTSRLAVLYSGTSREQIELQSIANSAAESIMRGYDWQALKRQATITGNGTQTAFSLPSDYDRMVTDAKLWSSRFSGALNHVVSEDQWLGLQTLGDYTTYGSWILYGGQVHIMPAPSASETVTYFYISNLFVSAVDGDNTAEFTDDGDTFRLDETLLKLAILWMFKQQKGRPYAEEMTTYERELSRRITKEGGSKILKMGGPAHSYPVAYPYALGQ